MRIWKQNERVQVTFGEQMVTATVILASPNGWSLALAFQALLGNYVGMMPVLWDDDAQTFRDLIGSAPVTITEYLTVHWLHHGLPICGFSDAVPRDWPSVHRWTSSEPDALTCAGCMAAHVAARER